MELVASGGDVLPPFLRTAAAAVQQKAAKYGLASGEAMDVSGGAPREAHSKGGAFPFGHRRRKRAERTFYSSSRSTGEHRTLPLEALEDGMNGSSCCEDSCDAACDGEEEFGPSMLSARPDDSSSAVTYGPGGYGHLPLELLCRVFEYLDGRDLSAAALVCRNWCVVAGEDELWTSLCQRELQISRVELEDRSPKAYFFRRMESQENLNRLTRKTKRRANREEMKEISSTPKEAVTHPAIEANAILFLITIQLLLLIVKLDDGVQEWSWWMVFIPVWIIGMIFFCCFGLRIPAMCDPFRCKNPLDDPPQVSMGVRLCAMMCVLMFFGLLAATLENYAYIPWSVSLAPLLALSLLVVAVLMYVVAFSSDWEERSICILVLSCALCCTVLVAFVGAKLDGSWATASLSWSLVLLPVWTLACCVPLACPSLGCFLVRCCEDRSCKSMWTFGDESAEGFTMVVIGVCSCCTLAPIFILGLLISVKVEYALEDEYFPWGIVLLPAFFMLCVAQCCALISLGSCLRNQCVGSQVERTR